MVPDTIFVQNIPAVTKLRHTEIEWNPLVFHWKINDSCEHFPEDPSHKSSQTRETQGFDTKMISHENDSNFSVF